MENTEKPTWSSIFKFNIIMLKSIGLWPPGKQSYGFNAYTIYLITSITLFQVAGLLFQTIKIFFIMNDIEAVVGTVFVLLSEAAAPLKSYGLFKSIKMLKQLVITVDFNHFKPKNVQQHTIMRTNITAFRIFFSIYMFFCLGYMGFCFFYPILDGSIKEYRLPFLAWYPYNYKKSPQYEMTYIYQVTVLIFIALAIFNIDTLIAGLNMFIGAQFDMLCDDFRQLGKEKKKVDVYEQVKILVNHHRELLKFASYTNHFYNWLIFVQFLIAALSLGFAMFLMTTVTPFSSFFFSIVFYIQGVTVQIFMYCWYGNEIEYKSSRLLYAVFESDWTGLNQETKKALCIFAANVEKPLQMSAFGLFYLSLNTFMKILRTGWSYFALLRQINSTT